MLNLNTFSVVARCPRTGMLGIAVSTAVPGVGGLCSYVEAGIGAVVTQSWVNPYIGIDGLALLREGVSAANALAQLMQKDPVAEDRQVGIVDAYGNVSAHTGSRCVSWAGHLLGEGYSVQGNMLTGAETIVSMAAAMAKTQDLELSERLMLALEAAQSAGGDKRGKQSAALKVCDREEYPLVDIRVDEHRMPVSELRRIHSIAHQQLVPFVRGMPTRANPAAKLPDAVSTMLLMPPCQRPGGSGA